MLSPGIKHSTGLLAFFLPRGFWRGSCCSNHRVQEPYGSLPQGKERGGWGAFSIRQTVAFGMKKCDLERLFRAVCYLTSAGQEMGPSLTYRLPRSQLMAIPVWLLGSWRDKQLGHGDPLCPLAALGREALACPHSLLASTSSCCLTSSKNV